MRETDNYKYKICQDADNAGEVLDAYGENFTAIDTKLKNIERGGGNDAI